MDPNTFREYVIKRLKQKYQSFFKDDFEDILMIMAPELQSISLSDDESYKKFVRKIRATKKRFIDNFVKNKNNEVYIKLQSIRYEYDRVIKNEISIEEFKEYHKVSSIEEYEKILFEGINLWKDNDDALLTEFTYINSISRRSIKSAFKNDIILVYYQYLKTKKYNNDTNIKRIPTVFGSMPLDPTNMASFVTKEEDEKLQKEIATMDTIDKLICDNEEESERLLMKLEKDAYLKLVAGKDVMDVVTQIALLKATKAMNDFDKEIISYFFSLFYNAPLDTEITVYMSDIAQGCGLTLHKRNYKAIRDSVIKLGKISLEYQIEGVSIVGNIISAYIDENDDRDKVTVACGPFLKKLLIMNSSYNFNKEAYDNLSKDAQQYAVWYQKRRLKQATKIPNNEEEITIVKAMEAILWNVKRSDLRIKRILRSLEELKNNKLVIEDYEYIKKKKSLIIKYIDLPQSIIEKIIDKNFEEGQYIEGKIIK